MIEKDTKIFGLAVVLLVIAIAGFAFSNTRSISPSEIDIVVPSGWYLHHTEKGAVILTRQQNLPDIGASEGLAYGEQITYSLVTMDKVMDEWIASRIPDNDPLFKSKETGMLNGHPTLKVEHEVEAAGKMLDFYVFSGDQAHIFSLYPLESYNAASMSTVRNTVDVQVLEQMVKDFATKL